ncbi:AraC family transcriptional regulator [Aquamicrobium zhengzhouense]|uniref:Helix-turn-helix transcriptional regulator n=1 Tax=Aquamicrobium zhengzhouense TaxID=2781738 RepID=A0ABS0S9G4_9HYPH|nr:helix-turn-helix transcriptional regulator [Aquamicrobium zhengzhouense]MBI1619940.1 helix-turn-helix transcriptional regulator [Aquamicrobium zhengzhouense]
MLAEIRSPDPSNLEWIERSRSAVIAIPGDYPDGHTVLRHQHGKAQLLHALTGVVMVSTAEGRWMVPPDHAMWIPAGEEHSVEMLGFVRMRSAYISPDVHDGLPTGLCVLAMTDLMRSLIIEAVDIKEADASDERGRAVMDLILLEIPRMPIRPFGLPFPADARLARLCRAFVVSPTPRATIDDWAREAGMSRRSFTRAFLAETGLSLSMWRQQATLFAALPRLAEGVSITELALDLGYESAPAFTTMFRRMLGASPRDYLRRRSGDGRSDQA